MKVLHKLYSVLAAKSKEKHKFHLGTVFFSSYKWQLLDMDCAIGKAVKHTHFPYITQNSSALCLGILIHI